MKIEDILEQIYPLPPSSREKLESCIKEVSFPRGHLLLRRGRVESKIYFVKKGIVRAYAYQNDSEITFWFGREGETIISMKSYVDRQPGYEDVELLEPCDLYEISTQNLRKLFDEDIHIANWGRRFAEKQLIKTEERLISREFRSAADRYKDLMEKNPDLLQRVQLGYIASYLGITQVSLSRIRSEIR